MILLYRLSGLAALAAGLVGIFVPLLPTIPFILLAAFCFARGDPRWEERLLQSRFGPAIRDWRASGAISIKGKMAAVAAFAASALAGLLLWEGWVAVLPSLVGMLGSIWIVTRPTALPPPQ